MADLPPISDDDLQDYVDGRMEDAQIAAFEGALLSNPDMAAKAAAYRAQKETMRQVYEPVLQEPVPKHLLDTVRRVRPKQTYSVLMRLAASLAFIAVGAAGGWYGNNYFNAGGLLHPFIEQATLAHKLAIIEQPSGLELDADDQDRISSRYIPAGFNVPVRLPTLRRSNLTPVSLVSAVDPNGTRMTVTYHDRKKRPRTLFVRKLSTGDDLPVKYKDEGETPVLYWIDGPLIYILVGEGEKDELVSIAEEIYRSSAAAALQPDKPIR